jgi:hypothetical protein
MPDMAAQSAEFRFLWENPFLSESGLAAFQPLELTPLFSFAQHDTEGSKDGCHRAAGFGGLVAPPYSANFGFRLP